MFKKIMKAAPDYLHLSVFEFIKHFFNLLTVKKYDSSKKYEDYTLLMGYSCRSLFEVCMEILKKEDLVIATTPTHHTSYRNIIENHVKPENIHIIDLNDNFNQIAKIPEVKKCDLVVITHMFGQDMDLSALSDFKEKHNCIVIEDRVQGGSLDQIFSDDVADISLYSMAMDKRPIALGGGYMYIDNKHEKIIKSAKEIINKLPKEKRRKRFIDLVKKIPTYLMYNSRIYLFMLVNTLNFLNIFIKRVNLFSFTMFYRTKNPGFSHYNYMLKPSNALLKSMHEKFTKYEKMENLYSDKLLQFRKNLSPEIVSYFFPWYKDAPLLTPYNTILIEEDLVDKFIEYLNRNNMICIANPTYKLFNFPKGNNPRYLKFNNGLVCIPSLANMKEKEMIFLANKLQEFHSLSQDIKKKDRKK